MKLDVNVLRYLSRDDFRTLTAVEMGQKNHEVVPATLIDTIAGLKHGGTFKCLKTLLRHKLVHHDGQKYDGYRLTTLGYDFLAIRVLVARGSITGVGRQIGVGKESDVFEVVDEEGNILALKLHRLGRTSFRAVKTKRDYVKRGNHISWLYLSRLAALKEFAFMKALGDAGLPVPRAIEVNRHAVLMTMIDAHPMVQVKEIENPRQVYEDCMKILVELAGLGLVHCDFNEFNLLIADDQTLTLIDFPQMVSTSHANAKELFERDVDGVVKFFERKLGYLPEDDEALERIRPTFEDAVGQGMSTIDEGLKASGFKKEHQAELERFIIGIKKREESSGDEEESKDEEENGEEESGEEGSEGEVSSEDEIGGEGEEEKVDEEGASSSEEDDDGGNESESCGSLDVAVAGDAEEENSIEKKNTTPKSSIEGNMAELQLEGEDDDASQVGELGDVQQQSAVAHRAADERRRAARRAAMSKASRNATKGKNAGKRKGTDNPLGTGGGW